MIDELAPLDFLRPEETEYLRREWLRQGRCPECRHLVIFHLYYGGDDACAIPECYCYR
jgi:hypothetical protein